MPANRDLLGERLGALGLAPHREEEILRELGDHLEDQAATLEAGGMASDAALRRALNDVSDWPAVRREIVSAELGEEYMNYRTKALWLPALCASVIGCGMLRLMQFSGLVPHFYFLSGGLYYTFYIPWLIALPIVGAIAAFWSKRAGGKPIHRLLAALAPSIGPFSMILTGPFIGLLIYLFLRLRTKGHMPSPWSGFHPPLIGVFAVLASWVLLPAVGLLIGALPFLRRPQPQS